MSIEVTLKVAHVRLSTENDLSLSNPNRNILSIYIQVSQRFQLCPSMFSWAYFAYFYSPPCKCQDPIHPVLLWYMFHILNINSTLSTRSVPMSTIKFLSCILMAHISPSILISVFFFVLPSSLHFPLAYGPSITKIHIPSDT